MLTDCTQLPGKSQTFTNAKDIKWLKALVWFHVIYARSVSSKTLFKEAEILQL